ncbi:phage tail-collar fiber domain-containing protein [Paenibacillus glufosinatiresistens]|uniref:phage tail-collar fiber domain-containing protein n=1 Tax=Paenibacillus glufosinatiresistens TaxID=3070657 RepID=UPI00286E2E79|nr:phage tail protein [Paenibacillus sp. YX.27]
MADFGGMTLTNKGLVLQGKAQAGTPLNYTRIAVGDGSLSGQSIPALNSLISPKKSLPVTRLKIQPPNRAAIGTVLRNAEITSGFYFREVGVFAQDPDAGEVLYAYANAGNTAEFIAGSGGSDVIEKAFDCVVAVGTAANVTAVIDESLVFARESEFTTHRTAAELDHPDGSVTAAKLAPAAATDAAIGSRTVSDSTAPTGDTGTLTGILGWLANMVKAITGKTSWRTPPATTLEAASGHMKDTVAHITAAERTAWNNGATAASVAIPLAQKGAASGVATLGSDGLIAPTQLPETAKATDYVRQPGYAADSGTANAKVVTLSPAPTAYVDGMAVSFKNSILSTAAVTINVNNLGAKSIVKSNGNALASSNLKAGSIYTVRYNATTGNFILQGEGGEYGTAGAAQVLTGYNVGTEAGLVSGTMANRGAVTITPGQSAQVIPDGYHNGGGVVPAVVFDAAKVLNDTTIAGKAGTMPNRANDQQATQVWTDGVGNLSLGFPTGGYVTNSGFGAGYASVAKNDPDFTASNIRSGVNIFGLTGTLSPRFMTTTRVASTIITSSTWGDGSSFNGSYPAIVINTASLGFVPAFIVASYPETNGQPTVGTWSYSNLTEFNSWFGNYVYAFPNVGSYLFRVPYNANSIILPMPGPTYGAGAVVSIYG